MIVAYAPGVGLGHLTRLRAAVHTLGLAGPLTIVTDSRFATDRRVTGAADVVSIARPREAPTSARDTLAEVVASCRASLVVLDATPAGPAGELDGDVVPAGTPILHLARAVRWGRYADHLQATPPSLQRVVPVEPLPADQLRWLVDHAERVDPILPLVDPPEPPRRPDGTRFDPLEAAGAWLVVHAGPPGEAAELVAYAREQAAMEHRSPRLVLVGPGVGAPAPEPGVEHLDVYPAWPLFAVAERVVTAAGANAVRQLAPWRAKHRMLPLERRLDDQHRRARIVR